MIELRLRKSTVLESRLDSMIDDGGQVAAYDDRQLNLIRKGLNCHTESGRELIDKSGAGSNHKRKG